MKSDADARVTTLLAFTEALAEARRGGEAAVRAAFAAAAPELRDLVEDVEVRTANDSPEVCGAILTLRVDRAPTFRAWRAVAGAPPGGPELVSPSNVPPEQWGRLPVSYTYPRTFGPLHVSFAHGDREERLTDIVVWFTAGSSAG